ncbi:MAG: cysteine desulfurase NifS [Phycisphaeraceae bacterium]|nr:MAG: cysteine desulfurase NifS [Phycisphaeraceae bacterium]
MRAYLDNNATTQPTPEVVDAVREALEGEWANPSSVHREGQLARRRVELARASIASLIEAKPRDVLLCSSGTESIDLAIRGVLGARADAATPCAIVTTAIEHAAVRDLTSALAREQDVEIRLAPLDAHGVLDTDAIAGLLDDSVALVSVQWANNETGAIHPAGRIGELCRARSIPFHCDAVQMVGKMPVDVRAPEGPAFDLLTLSAHKLHGPKGVGGLWVRPTVGVRPVVHGAQELGRRGGTENVPGIAGAGVAAEQARAWLADDAERARLGVLRDRLESRILERVPGTVVNGPREHGARLWNTTNIALPGLEAEAILMVLSDLGVAASAGAACSSGSLDPSPVLLAMGVDERVAHGSVRLSLSRFTTEAEAEHAVGAFAAAAERLGFAPTPPAGGR